VGSGESAPARALRTGQMVEEKAPAPGDPTPEYVSRLWVPISETGQTPALIYVGWTWPVRATASRASEMASLYAAEASMVIKHADAIRQLNAHARTDSLTGLRNRRDWEDQVPRLMALAARNNTELSVVVLDLDHFKAYNDDWGHEAGDRLLHELAGSWGRAIRATDILARIGGDEFALALPSCPSDNARIVVDRVRAFTAEGQSFSAGIALWNGTETLDELLARADAALYESKRSRRGGAVTAEIANDETGLVYWAAVLPEVLKDRSIRSVYQPICDVRTGVVVGYEALARPAGAKADLSVDGLFTAAQRLGAWRDLDWLCRRAAVDGARSLAGNNLLFINVGVRALLDPVHGVDQMMLLMEWGEIPASRIVLELSERDTVSDSHSFRVVLEAYREAGFRFALDDVGEGHSTLETLAAADPEYIKIARSLTRESTEGGRRAVIRALVEFARSNGAAIIAEGIETEAELASLRELGVELGQGYLLGRPADLPQNALMVASRD
jgi:diguanylate cyclase (GGDEF)-like protein